MHCDSDNEDQQNQDTKVVPNPFTKKMFPTFVCKFCTYSGPSIKALTAHAQRLHRSEWFRMTSWEDIAEKVSVKVSGKPKQVVQELIEETGNVTNQDQVSSDEEEEVEIGKVQFYYVL